MPSQTSCPPPPDARPDSRTRSHTREALLVRTERRLEVPMLVLGAVWLALLVVELTSGLSPLLETVGTVIWAIFLIDFGLVFAIAHVSFLPGPAVGAGDARISLS